MSFRNPGRHLRLEIPRKRSRKLSDCCGGSARRAPFHRTEQRHKPFAKHRNLRARAAPARESVYDLRFERAVQRVGHEPGLAVGQADQLARAQNGAAALDRLDQGDVALIEASAIGEGEADVNLRVGLIAMGHCGPAPASAIMHADSRGAQASCTS